MLKIPEAVKRVHYDVEAEQYFFPEGSLAYLCHAGLVNLANIGESLYKENTKNNNYDRNNDEVFVDPLFTIKLERVGIVRCICSCLEVNHRLNVILRTNEVLTYAYISGVKVYVELKNLSPVIESFCPVSVQVVVKRTVDSIAVCCTLICCDGVHRGVENVKVAAKECNCCCTYKVTELLTLITKREKEYTVSVVYEYL